MENQNASGSSESSNQFNGDTLVTLTSDIVAAYVGSSANHIAPNEISGMITSIHASLVGLSGSPAPVEARREPAVSVRSSIKPDYIVCLEDGKKLKMLKRYIMTQFGMTPDQYRSKWGLASDYPMVAPNYAEQRRQLAKSIGLGTKRTRSSETVTEATSDNTQETPARRGRPPKAATGATPARRGRPPKAAATGEATPARRGRKPKAANA